MSESHAYLTFGFAGSTLIGMNSGAKGFVDETLPEGFAGCLGLEGCARVWPLSPDGIGISLSIEYVLFLLIRSDRAYDVPSWGFWGRVRRQIFVIVVMIRVSVDRGGERR